MMATVRPDLLLPGFVGARDDSTAHPERRARIASPESKGPKSRERPSTSGEPAGSPSAQGEREALVAASGRAVELAAVQPSASVSKGCSHLHGALRNVGDPLRGSPAPQDERCKSHAGMRIPFARSLHPCTAV